MAFPLVSIIAPVFNNEKDLRAFIESVLSQTYTNWELILVDDGSTDSSGSICDEYNQRDSRINVIHHPSNGGISRARNTGILHSNGEWLFVSDADDTLFQDSISSMVECISDDIDLISAAYLRYIDGVLQQERKASVTSKVSIQGYVELIGVFPQSRNLERYVWNKLFRASIIKDNAVFFYEDLKLFEDVCFVYQYLEYCKDSVYCIAVPVYSYFRRSGGTAMSSRNHYNDRTLSWLLAYTRILAIIGRMDVPKIASVRLKDEVFGIYHYIIKLIRKEKKGVKEENKVRTLLGTCFLIPERCVYDCRYYIKRSVLIGKSFIHKFVRLFRR